VSPAKTAEQIEMPFGGLTRVGPRNRVLDGVQILQGEGLISRGLSGPFKSIGSLAVVYTKTAEPTEMPFRVMTHVGPRNHLLDGRQGRTNPFAATKDDNTAMRPFVKII